MNSTDTTAAEDNPALLTAVKAFTSLTREQKTTLSRALEGFVSCLAPADSETRMNPCTRSVLTQESWEQRGDWGADEWNAWETWGWYQHFCRAVRIVPIEAPNCHN
jgi:nuclear cap-binding protein subunit 1